MLDALKHRRQQTGGSVPGAEVFVPHDKISDAGGVVAGVFHKRDAVVGVSDIAIRVERFQKVVHRLEVGASAGRIGGALIAHAPGKDTGMIEILLDHLTHHLLGQGNDFRVRHLLATKLPHGNFRDQQNAVAVGVVEDVRVLRVVDGTGEGHLEILHIVPVVFHRTACLGQPLPGRLLMARHARQTDRFAVQEEMPVANLDGARAEIISEQIKRIPARILQDNFRAVNIGVVEIPELYRIDPEHQGLAL